MADVSPRRPGASFRNVVHEPAGITPCLYQYALWSILGEDEFAGMIVTPLHAQQLSCLKDSGRP